MSIKFSEVKLDVQDHVALLTLNSPNNQNSYSPQMSEDLLDAWTECENPDIHSIILTGTGNSFCGGFDVQALKNSEEGAAKKMSRMTVCPQYLSTVPAVPIVQTRGPRL